MPNEEALSITVTALKRLTINLMQQTGLSFPEISGLIIEVLTKANQKENQG